MRIVAAVVVSLLGASAALAQSDGRTRPDPAPAAKPAAEAKAKPSPKAEAKSETKPDAKPGATTDGKAKLTRKKAIKEKPKATASAKPSTSGSADVTAPEPKPSALRDAYMAIPFADRIAMQSDLAWGGDYNGPIDGEFSDRLVEAARAYQKRHKEAVSGILTPEQRAALAAAVEPRKQAVGWQLVSDSATGARLGIPAKFAPKTTAEPNGTRWSSEQGQLQIQTFRIDTGATIEGVFEQQKKMPRRRLESSALQGDSFVIRGMQGLKKMVVRGYARNGEVRGLTILYDQATEGTIDPLVGPITSAYVPFPSFSGASVAAGPPRRRVEYGSGVFVSSGGHLLTDRRLVEGCNVIVLPGYGNAERLAVDGNSGLALLRVYGARSVPIGWAGAPAAEGDVALVGVADPQSQAGGSAVSTIADRFDAPADKLDTAPAPGFTGAAALDGEGRFAGVVVSKPSLVAGPGAPQAGIVPVERIRSFLVSNQLTLASGKPGLDEAKAAVTRVICVRN